MKYCLNFLVFTICITFFFSCNNGPKEPFNATLDQAKLEETLLKANKRNVRTEDEQIRDLIARYKWEMKETGTGLRYLIYKKGTGPKAQKDLIARINYEVRLLSGEVVYSSKESGAKEFKIGSGGVESGLEEGILFLHLGDQAKLIFPSHLAYGLIGDQDKIPPRSTLIYDVELLGLMKIPDKTE